MKENKRIKSQPLFELGRVVATPGALALLDETATDATSLLNLHQVGDWGSIPSQDAEENRLIPIESKAL